MSTLSGGHFIYISLLFLLCDLCLRGRESRDRYTEGRAGDVVQANLVAELDARRIAAVFAADAKLDVRANALAQFNRHLDELANAFLIEAGKWIGLEDLLLVVIVEELACVVTAEAERHLA